MNKTITALKYSIREFHFDQRVEKQGTSTGMPSLGGKKLVFYSLSHSTIIHARQGCTTRWKNLRHIKPLVLQVEEEDHLLEGIFFSLTKFFDLIPKNKNVCKKI